MREDRETAVAAVLSAMAGDIAAGAPRGWRRAELRGFVSGPGSLGVRGFRFAPAELNAYGSNDHIPYDGMAQLYSLLDACGQLTIELEVETRGRYHAVLSQRLDRLAGTGFRYLIDPDREPPEIEAPPVYAAEAGDPDEAVALFGEYLRRLREILGPDAFVDLARPLPEARRRQLLSTMDLKLPRDLAALYAVVDGDGGQGLLPGRWFGLATLAELCRPEERWWVRRERDFITEFGPPLRIQRRADHPGWIPFAADGLGNYLAVDMSPGPHGSPGQVILIGRNHGDGPVYVADSVTTLLGAQVAALESGLFRRDEGALGLLDFDLERHKRDYAAHRTLAVTGPEAAPVRGMHQEIRELTVSNAPWVDLGPVRGAPALWRFTATNCPGADLAPLRDTQIEVIDLDLAAIDLTGLAGHPTLRRVVLHSEKPVDLRPLLSCPRLSVLDVAHAPAADVSGLGGATALWQLTMLRPQWVELLRHNVIPPHLAVADLAGEPREERRFYWSFAKAYKTARPTLKDAVAWARNLTGTDIQTFTGRFATES